MESFILHVSRKLFSFLHGFDECVRAVEAFVACGNDFLRLFISLYRTVVVVAAHTSYCETEPRVSESLYKSFPLVCQVCRVSGITLSRVVIKTQRTEKRLGENEKNIKKEDGEELSAILKRITGLGPATSTLARLRSTK